MITRKADIGQGRIFRFLRNFTRNKSGAASIETAIIIIPFFILLFSIFEIGISFIAGEVLKNAGANAARLIRTGQAQNRNFDSTLFRQNVLDDLTMFPFSGMRLTIIVEVADDFSDLEAPQIIDANRRFIGADRYNHGSPNDIVAVRLYYRWPMITSAFRLSLTDLSSGERLLNASYLFKNEPFLVNDASLPSGPLSLRQVFS